MKSSSLTQPLLRLALLAAMASGASNEPTQPVSPTETWLTREEFRARDGSLLRLHEHRYADVELPPEAGARRGLGLSPPSEYLDLGGSAQVVESAQALEQAQAEGPH